METDSDVIMNGTNVSTAAGSDLHAFALLDDEPKPPTASTDHIPTEPANPSPPQQATYTKRLLPTSLFSNYPHGLITGQPRSPSQQAAFEARKAEILGSMSDDQIEERYQETAKKVEDAMKEIEEGNERLDREAERARKTRETERKAWANLKKADAEG